MERPMDDKERTTTELLQTLDSDYRECYSQLLKRLDEGERTEDGTIPAGNGFAERQLIRAAFAYIEGATYVLKIEALFNAEEKGIDLTPQQSHFIFEADFDLNDEGEVTQRPAKISLARNIRFAISIYEQANGLAPHFDPNAEWWSLLRKSIRVRDRLMHPRWPTDLDVAPAETIAMAKAKAGFDEVLETLLATRKV